MRAFYGWKFVLTIALPLLMATLGVAGLTFELVGRVSTGANIQDRERTRQIVKSAMDSIQLQLANIATDNAYWDDAAQNLYGTINESWVEQGGYDVSTESGVYYDAMLVIDRDIPAAVAGYRKGQSFAPVLNDYFSGKIEPLLDLFPQDFNPQDSKSAIMNTADGLAVVAVAPILPTSEGIAIDAAKPRYMVLEKFLTPEYLAAVGRQYVIDDLKLAAAGTEASGGEMIADFSGAPVAAAQWTDRRPGDIARAAVMEKAVAVLGFLVLVMLGIGILCWRLIDTIAKREAAARHDALHDPLTGLPNRAGLYSEIGRLAQLQATPIAVVFADLDGFKEVNDTYDHETGDRLIEAVAAGLSHLAAGRGMVCRLGGDEFVVLFSGENAGDRARHFAQSFVDFLRIPFDLDGRQAAVGASIGISGSDDGDAEAQELMRRADIAMYKAKAGGKSRVCVYSADFDAERNDNIGIANELREIIAGKTLDIAFQPVVDAGSRKIVGVEALARWPSTSPRRVTPDRFIRVAEVGGLIDDLGDLILAKACAAARKWPDLRLAVNISPVQLENPNFVQRTLGTIAHSGIDPHRVELEITEGTLVNDIAKAKQIFNALRGAGIQIVLDDFGTGFSSIGYLRQFNFDRIKIDRSLVDRVLMGSAEQHIVQGTMMMASGLTASVTAEGIEREEQINILRLTGCNEMQGYFFFKPMPAADITRVLSPMPSVAALPVRSA